MTEDPGRELSLQDWEKLFWQDGSKDPTFHSPKVHSSLLKYQDKLFPQGKSGRVFVPLCGKSVDMVHLADLGHEVVGIEMSHKGIVAFFTENNFAFTKSKVENSPLEVYNANEKRITIYQGDFFSVSPEVFGEFDAVWDRGSLVAININQRKEYSDVMFKLMKPTAKYLIHCYNYDGAKFGGPPHYVTENSLEETFGRKCSIELLETVEIEPPSRHIREVKIPWSADAYLLKPKQ